MKLSKIIRNLLITLMAINALLLSSPSKSDEAADKAEFQKLYAQFNDLYANSEDLNPIIEVAEKLYNLAPKIYGETSPNTAVITYNLATLYDARGINDNDNDNDKITNEQKLKDELKASNLYKKYFRMENLRKVPKDIDYINKYIPYIVAYYNSHPNVAELKISDTILEIAYSQNLPDTEMADLELYIGIIRAKHVGIVYAVENFQKAVNLYSSDKTTNASKIAESLFWLSRHDIGLKKYDSAEKQLTEAVILLDKNEPDIQLLKNEALQLLATMKIMLEDIESAENYYKKIITPEGHKGYLIAIKKPASYPPMKDVFLDNIPAFVEVQFDVDMYGKPFNIKIPYLEVIEKNWLAPVNINQFSEYIISLVENTRYLPPLRNNEKTVLRDVKDTIIFRPNMVH